MSTYNLWVNGAALAAVGSWAATGGTIPGVLSDSSDLSYYRKTSSGGTDHVTMPCTDLSLPGTEFILSVAWQARLSQPTVGNAAISLVEWYSSGDQSQSPSKSYLGGVAGRLVTTLVGAALQARPKTNTAWTQAAVNAMAFRFDDLQVVAASSPLFEAGLLVKTTTIPSAPTVSAPSGAIVTTATPLVQWTHNDTDGVAQVFYQVGVFSSAQYGIGGFDPGTSPSTWSSGTVSGPASQVTTPALTNGTGYRAYVRTGKIQNGLPVWGPWSFSSFTMSLTAPPTPTISASFDTTNNRVALTIAGSANVLSADDASAETTVGTWTALTNCGAPTRSTAQFSDGAASIAMSSTAAGTMDAITATGLSGEPVIGSTSWSAIADFRAAVSARTVGIKIRWYDAAGAFLSDSTISTTGTAESTTGFVTRSTTATSPSNAAFAAVIAEVQATAAGAEVHYVDKIALHPGTTPTWSPGGSTLTFAVTRNLGGASVAVRGTPLLDAAQRATVYDYEATRGTTPTYSVAEVATFTAGSVLSLAATTGPVTVTNDGTWWLKAVANPTLNRGGLNILADPGMSQSRVENLGVFRPDGRTDPVIVAGQTFGDDSTFGISATTATEWEAVKALAMHQGTLLLQEPYTDSTGAGEQRYIRLTDRSWSKQGVPTAPMRFLHVTALEVGRGY